MLSIGADLVPFTPLGWSDDLVISKLSGTHSDADPFAFTTADMIYVDYAVKNQGTATTGGPFAVQLLLDSTLIQSFNHSSLNAGEPGAYSDFGLGPLPAGTYTVDVSIDPDDDIDESNEANNLSTRILTVGPQSGFYPDLTLLETGSDPIVVRAQSGASPITSEDEVLVDFSVQNVGNAASENFSVEVALNGNGSVFQWTFPVLPPTGSDSDLQKTAPFTISFGQLLPGPYTVEVFIDPAGDGPSGGEIDESNEDNNYFSRDFIIQGPGDPDLRPAVLQGSWDDVIVLSKKQGTNRDELPILSIDQHVYVDVGVGNFGHATAGRFDVDVTLDGTLVKTFTRDVPLGGVPPGSPQGWMVFADDFQDFDLGALAAGEHTITIEIDPQNQVSEGYDGEDNNTYSRTFWVYDPATIRGVKWNDSDGDGVKDGDEPGLPGWRIFLDLDSNGEFNSATEPSTLTAADNPATPEDEAGTYEFAGRAPGTYVVGELVPSDSWRQMFPGPTGGMQVGFDVDIRFIDGSLTAAQKNVILQAAARWEEIITGDLPDAFTTDGLFVDDVAIDVFAGSIDGAGNVVADAMPFAADLRPGSMLPARAQIRMDSEDLSLLEEGRLFNIAVHEIAHALGFGSLWDADHMGLVFGAGGGDPQFNGPAATAEYNSIFGLSASSVPLENTGGEGTRDAHWRQSGFDDELMTGTGDFGGSSGHTPLSRITAASLADLGYQVDLGKADPYGPPSSILPLVNVIAGDPEAAEEGANQGQFLVTRTGSTAAPLVVYFGTGGTATSEDYGPLGSSVTIGAGQSSAALDVLPLDDDRPEVPETVRLTLSTDAAYTIGSPNSATVTITDNEPPAGTILYTHTVTVGPGEVAEDVSFGNRLNEPPELVTTAGEVDYVENGPPVVIDPGLTLSDPDNAYLTRATVELSGVWEVGEDTLAFAPQPGISGHFDQNSGILTLTGEATAAAYQAALRSVTYFNDSENPTPGVRTILFRAKDDVDLAEVSTKTINVTAVNDQPSFTVGANQTVDEDAGLQTIEGWATGVSAGALDESDQVLTFEVTGNSNSGLFSFAPAVDPASGGLTFTPAADASGTATITLVLSDDGGVTDGGVDTSLPQEFTITVNPVNDPPSFTAGADQSVDEDADPRTVAGWATNISPGPPDELGQTLWFDVIDNTAPELFFSLPAVDPISGDLTFTPLAAESGTATITLVLHDDGGVANGGVDTSLPREFTITVNPVNDPPSFTAGSDHAAEDDDGPQSIASWATNVSAGPPDESGQVLAFDVIGNSNPALFAVAPAVDPTGGELTYTPAVGASGTATITLVLRDDGGGPDTSDPQDFTITVVQNVGTFDFLAKDDLDPSGSDLWYRVETTRGGVMTATAAPATGGGDASLVLYDANPFGGHIDPVAVSTVVGGNQRIDLQAAAGGEEYYLKLSSSGTDVDLRLANLLEHDGTTVTVHQTAGDDEFEFEAVGSYRVAINGVEYHFEEWEVDLVTFQGEGDDSAVLIGSPGPQTAVFNPNSASLAAAGFEVIATGCSQITIRGGGGADVVSLYDSPGDDLFQGNPGGGTLSGTGFTGTVVDFPTLHVYAKEGGTDVAHLYDSPLDDELIAKPTFAKLTGEGFFLRVKFFEEVYAHASEGYDVAVLSSNGGSNTFTATPTEAAFTGEGFSNHALFFDSVQAYARAGAYDTATLYDSPGDDTFLAWPKLGKLFGDGFLVRVKFFAQIVAQRTAGGKDVATFYDSDGDDTFTTSPEQTELVGDGFRNAAVQFDEVYGYADEGGYDVAHMYDSPGDDTFYVTPGDGKLYGPGYYSRAIGFDAVHGYGTSLGRDVAHLYDSPGDDEFVGKPDYSKLSGPGYLSRVKFFEAVHGYGTAGGRDVATLYGSAGDDTFIGWPTCSKMLAGDHINRVKLFEEVYARGAQGGNDTAELHDSSGDDLLEAADNWARLSSNNAEVDFLYELIALQHVTAASTTGNDTKSIATPLEVDLMLTGPWV